MTSSTCSSVIRVRLDNFNPGYRVCSTDISIDRNSTLSDFLAWASGLIKLVPLEYLASAVIEIYPTEDGIESFISWREPIK